MLFRSEAQALGVPVVGTRDSSLDEMIVEGETGYLAENGDGESLCAAIERLLGQTEGERERMKEAILAKLRAETQAERDQQAALSKQVRDELKKIRDTRTKPGL